MFPGSQKEGGFHGKGKLCQVNVEYVRFKRFSQVWYFLKCGMLGEHSISLTL